MIENLVPILLEALENTFKYALGFVFGFWKFWLPIILILIVPDIINFIFFKSKYKSRRSYFSNWRYFKKREGKPETLEEEKLGNLLRQYGWNIRHQQWDGHKTIDIAIPEARFNIEVEGSQHNLNPNQARSDLLRDYYSEQKGFVTKRIPNSLLRDDLRAEETARLLNKELQERAKQLRK